MKKKKLLIIVIVIIVLLVLIVAIGGSGSGDSEGDASVSEEETADEDAASSENSAEDETQTTDMTFESQTLVDNDECTITVTGIDEYSMLGYLTLSVEIENKSSDVNYMFAVNTAYINGVESDPLWAEEVAPGKSAIESIAFDTDTLEDYGIDTVTDIEIYFIVYNNDDWSEDYIVDEAFNIYPYGEEAAVKFERETLDTDTVLIDNDYITVILIGYDADSTWGYGLDLYLVNKTDTEVMYSIDDSSVNGYMTDPYWAKSIEAGMSAFSTVSYYESDLEEIGITDLETQIETIEFTFSAYDNEDWSADDFVEELITLNP